MSLHVVSRDTPLIPITWRERVERAESVQEVVMAARDFIAGLDPYDMYGLPREIRPIKFVDGDDIASYSLDIVRYHCEQNEDTAVISARLAEFFSAAAHRIGQLSAASNSDQEEPRQLSRP